MTSSGAPVLLHPAAAEIGRAFSAGRGSLSLSAAEFAAAEDALRALPAAEHRLLAEHLVALAITLHGEDARAAEPAVAQLCDLAALLLTSKNEALRMFADAQVRVADAGQAFAAFSDRTSDRRPRTETATPVGHVKAQSIHQFVHFGCWTFWRCAQR